MSFGFGVGDFLAVIDLASRIRTRFVDAPGQFKAISDEVKGLSNVLRDIDDVLQQRDLADQRKTELGEIAQGCRDVLKELEDTLDRYQELDPNTKGLGGRSRRVWKRLRWDQKDIDGFRSRITLNVIAFGTFFGQITSNVAFAIKASVDLLHERQDDRERREEHQVILDWLTPIDYTSQQNDFFSRRQEGTGEWLLKSDEFQEWLTKTKKTMFCPGIPGAGKTITTSIVIKHLHTEFQNDTSIGIAYLYCNFRRQQEETSEALLLSLLKQLIQDRPLIPENIKNLYESHKSKRTRPSLDEISKELHSVITGYSRTFIIIDALDECQVSDGGRKRFQFEIFNFQAKTGVNIFATSRFIPEIMKEFEGSVLLEIRANDEDIQRYIDGHTLNLPAFVSGKPKLQEEIKIAIVEAVDGMFLLAQLHLDSLSDKTTPKEIRGALKKLSKGSGALYHAYKKAMERIEGQRPGFQNLAKRVLSWIACAQRPLTTLELQHALAVEVGEPELDEENFPDIGDIVPTCAGLVTVDEESKIIRLVHYTTQEYLQTHMVWLNPQKDLAITNTQKNDVAMADAQRNITMTCVTYLLFDAFETGFCPTNKEFEARLQLNPLYDYATRNWGHHARVASTEVEQLVLDFLESEVKVSAVVQAMLASRSYSWDSDYNQRVSKEMTGIHLAAYFGLKEAIIALLKNGHDLNSKGTTGRTPLSWAAENGHEAVVELLLAMDGVQPDSKDTSYRETPLSWAAKNGHKAVVELLLAKNGVDPDSKGIHSRTPLWWAAQNGHEAVVKLLLASGGVNPDSKDTDYRERPLSWAIENGHEAVVKVLLEKGAKMDFLYTPSVSEP